MATRRKLKSTTHSPELLVKFYKEMLYYRRFEERVNQSYMKQMFSGFCHLHIGQEAVCVGVQNALRDSDYLISGYRSHTQALAKGISPFEVMSELFGKVTGCSRGKGGSMHMFSAEHRFLGGHGIVGGQVPLAAGAAFAIKYRKEDDICVCYIGDAATNQGQFFEALNMAAIWELPVLVIIENNRYGMGTDIRRTTSIDHLWKRALAFDMEHSDCDGMDVLKTYVHVKAIVDDMRKSPKPHLLEANTYRYRGHSVSDPGHYRTKEEVQKYQEIDPITTLGRELVTKKIVTEEELKTWDTEMKNEIKEIVEKADNAAEPDSSEIWQHVYVNETVPEND